MRHDDADEFLDHVRVVRVVARDLEGEPAPGRDLHRVKADGAESLHLFLQRRCQFGVHGRQFKSLSRCYFVFHCEFSFYLDFRRKMSV